MHPTPAQRTIIALIVANIIWGAGTAVFKIALVNIPPMTLAFWRFFLAAIILFLMAKKSGAKMHIQRKDLKYVILYTITGITINIIFYFLGLKLTHVINASIIISSQPIMTLILAITFLHEPFVKHKFIGVILGCVGIVFIILEPILAGQIGSSTFIGNLFIIIATIGAVLQTLFGRKVLPHYDSFAFTSLSFLMGALSFLPFALFEYSTMAGLYNSIDWRGVMGIIYGVFFSGVGAYGLYDWALGRISASDTVIFSYLSPIAGTILGFFLLHENISALFLVGSLFIIAGIVISEEKLLINMKRLSPKYRRISSDCPKSRKHGIM
jgi:drug/metabolite transporter (DMT)-like permease